VDCLVLRHLLQEKELVPGTVGMRMSAMRFLYKKVLKRRDLAYDALIFPKRLGKLAVALSQLKVKRLIEAAYNLLFRTARMVLYSTGVRPTEASLSKMSDVDRERQVIQVRQGRALATAIFRCLPTSGKPYAGTGDGRSSRIICFPAPPVTAV
jgi:integrase